MNNDFVKKIKKYITDNGLVEYGDTVVLGVSGGADSVALLFVMDSLKDEFGLKLNVVHINHGLREEAALEAEYVQRLALSKNIPYTLFEYDVNRLAGENGLGTEEMGRKLRYGAFNDVLEKLGGKGIICVAHNENDCAETMLFNLFRGTGLKGLGAIAPKRGNVVRPLLGVSRDEIEKYLSDLGVEFCTDKSNLTDEYTRNRIRNKVIPLVRQSVCDEAIPHISETASQLREVYSFLEGYVGKAFDDCVVQKEAESITLDIGKMLKYDVYIEKLLVKKMIDYLVPMNKDITHIHIESVLNLLSKHGSHEADIPYGIKFYTSYGLLFAKLKEEETSDTFEAVSLKTEGTTAAGENRYFESRVFKKTAEFIPLAKTYTKWFDYDKIKQSLSIRTRQKGDFICVNKECGRKKLKDYFIDEKIPVKERDETLLVACESEIIWIVGYRINEKYKVTEETENILEVSFWNKESEGC